MISRKRDGSTIETYDGEGKFIDKLYGSKIGNILLPILISPTVSHVAGRFLDSSISRCLVEPFIKKNHLDLTDYPKRRYQSFNDFFTRTIQPGKRPLDPDCSRLVSPCDSKLTIFKLQKDSHFTIKGSDYTLETLLRNKKLVQRFCDGYGILLRLSVDDYHRYMYPVSGKKSKNYRIPGVYHTVNPRAAMARSIYRENTREYTLIKTENYGTVLMMEIGAMLVGRITNLHDMSEVKRGQEKGYFEFGGSSIILLMEKNHFLPDEDLILYSRNGEETVVKQGEGIGQLQ